MKLEWLEELNEGLIALSGAQGGGLSYRSGIYYVSDAQKQEALKTIADINASGIWPGKVVTEIAPAGAFWEAEPEHQDYLVHFPNGYTCHYPRANWLLPPHVAT